MPLLLLRLITALAALSALPSNAASQTPPAAAGARDGDGRLKVTAVRLREPLVLDGHLDEAVYREAPPLGPFTEQEPNEGARASEQTDTWIFFDDTRLYVSAQCWDSQADRIVANEMRRDHQNVFENDNFAVALDTFRDFRNGFLFQTNALGAQRDQEVTEERTTNLDWNTLWEVKARRFEKGWTVEMAIPFKSLRYRGSGVQEWGVNIRRIVRSKNEVSFLTPIPRSYSTRGVYKFSSAATLQLEVPPQKITLEVKPYGITALTDTRDARRELVRDGTADAGFDVKYGLTKGLTADFTYNTDFAQVEEDERQINLTRFSLFFPEKRDFFLEGQGLFFVSGQSVQNVSGSAPTLMPIMFFSRRIGLNEGRQVPVIAGGRVTGRAGKYAIGALQINTAGTPSANAAASGYSVVRIRRDFLRRSTVGVIATNRSPRLAGAGTNQVLGFDAALAFYENVFINTYYAQSWTPNRRGDQSSYMGQFHYTPDRYGFNYEYLRVGDAFNSEIGFLRRNTFRRNYGSGRFSPRPANSRRVRKYTFEGSGDYVTDLTNVLESRNVAGVFRTDFNTGDSWTVRLDENYELLRQPFEIATGVRIAPGGYDFYQAQTEYLLGPQRRVTGTARLAQGSFYSGTKTEVGYTGRVDVNTRLAFEPRLSINWVRLAEGDFTAKIFGTRTTLTFNTRAAVSALLQYGSNDRTLSTNIRLRWEYQPGSDLFVVYSDARDTDSLVPDRTALQNRAFVIKLTRLFRL